MPGASGQETRDTVNSYNGPRVVSLKTEGSKCNYAAEGSADRFRPSDPRWALLIRSTHYEPVRYRSPWINNLRSRFNYRGYNPEPADLDRTAYPHPRRTDTLGEILADQAGSDGPRLSPSSQRTPVTALRPAAARHGRLTPFQPTVHDC
jgi:hypothetical protein